MFVFGSSLVSNGNNNFFPSQSQLNYLPYGIDFPGGPTGRATNGKNIIDFFADNLKLPPFCPPPFSDPSTKGPQLVHGVNFASAGSGIIDDTSPYATNATNLNAQIDNFETVTLPALEAQLGSKRSDFLPNYLFVVGTGGNDYLFNYFTPKFIFKNATDLHPEVFAENLANLLYQKLHIIHLLMQKLYSLGGRNFLLISIYPMGCIPQVRFFLPLEKGCFGILNIAVQLFNARMSQIVDDSRTQMPGSTFVFVNSYKILYDIIKDYASQGFEDERNACCETEGGKCRKDGEVCDKRDKYVFFDGLHPTEATNKIIATKAFNSFHKNEVFSH
ncbi:hypothetical protein Patl1_07880 [Pistacia atlantica]|uniref:Uncharacterized protein n=1 Tax=Pistacia atlantica TaxID=434234 RepID=A0ACC1AI92_9ROSI|nr:hypothetical protein Patl1_07880 [Pistacia atlantica]